MTEIAHGTRAAYRIHRKNGETPCPDCRAAEARYNRERRAAKARPSTPAADAPAIPEEAIKYLAIAEEGIGRWVTSFGWIESGGSQAVTIDDGSIGLPVGEQLINRVLDLVEKQRPAVLLVSRSDATKLGRFGQLLLELPGCKIAVAEDPASWVRATDGNRAHHLAASSVGMIGHAAHVLEGRQELEKQIEQETSGRRIVGAVVDRGKMFRDLGEYEAPKVEYDPIPSDHPAARQESWVGVIAPPKKSRGRWSGGRQ
jgi:hypothetical protein